MQEDEHPRAALAARLATTRARVAAVAPRLPVAGFSNPPEIVGSWFGDAADAAASRAYIAARPADPPARTIYVELNDVDLAPGRWTLSGLAFGRRTTAGVSVSEWFDSLVGEELGDLRVDMLHLTGMEAVQEWFAAAGPAQDEAARPVEDLVRLSMYDLVDRGLDHAGGCRMRVVARRHEEPRLALWEPTGPTSFRLSLHAEDADE